MKIDLILRKLLSVLSHVVLILFLLSNIYAEHSGQYLVTVGNKLAFAAGFVGLWTLATYIGAPPQENEEARRRRLQRYLRGLFCYYLWILCNMLFFDAVFGRSHGTAVPHMNFYEADINLQPLKTICNYLRAYAHGRINGHIVAINLVGNLAAFAPMGFFLPALCRPMRNVFLFLLSIIAMVCLVEATQIATMTGSCDIDDLILNTAGALLIWLIVQLPFIRKRAYRVAPPTPGKGKKQ
ncbi:MAG: VanZ family protein [Intestinibacillus sp.]